MPRATRRQALEMLLGLGVFAVTGCGPSGSDDPAPDFALPAQVPGGEVGERARHADDVDALCDVLLPTERNPAGEVLSPGAREADVDGALRIEDFVALATAQGLLPPLPDVDVRRFAVDLHAKEAFRALLNTELGVLASRHRPLTAFRDLPRELQEAIVEEAFDDEAQRPLLLVMRAACFLAFLGAVTNDVGLRAVGFPPFEDFADGRAVSGYPRTKSGRLVDVAKEDLRKLAAKGDLDDYTYNRDPAPTSGDDLSTVLDAAGDLL